MVTQHRGERIAGHDPPAALEAGQQRLVAALTGGRRREKRFSVHRQRRQLGRGCRGTWQERWVGMESPPAISLSQCHGTIAATPSKGADYQDGGDAPEGTAGRPWNTP